MNSHLRPVPVRIILPELNCATLAPTTVVERLPPLSRLSPGLPRERGEGAPGAERHHEERPHAEGALLGHGLHAQGEAALGVGQQRAARDGLLHFRRAGALHCGGGRARKIDRRRHRRVRQEAVRPLLSEEVHREQLLPHGVSTATSSASSRDAAVLQLVLSHNNTL